MHGKSDFECVVKNPGEAGFFRIGASGFFDKAVRISPYAPFSRTASNEWMENGPFHRAKGPVCLIHRM